MLISYLATRGCPSLSSLVFYADRIDLIISFMLGRLPYISRYVRNTLDDSHISKATEQVRISKLTVVSHADRVPPEILIMDVMGAVNGNIVSILEAM